MNIQARSQNDEDRIGSQAGLLSRLPPHVTLLRVRRFQPDLGRQFLTRVLAGTPPSLFTAGTADTMIQVRHARAYVFSWHSFGSG